MAKVHPKVKLTAGRVRDYSCAAGKAQSFLWDSDVPGLAVRATVNGAKAFVFQGKLNGKTIRITIGDVGTWDIEGTTKDVTGRILTHGAREEARRLQALIDNKVDPRHARAEEIAAAEAKRAEKAAKQEAERIDAVRRWMLVSDAWTAYIEFQKAKMTRKNIERKKKWGGRHLLDHLNMATAGGEAKKRGKGLTKAGPLYPLLQLRLADITANALKEWQRTEAESRANGARQAFEAFRAFWRWCGSIQEYSGAIDLSAVESKDVRDEVPGRKTKEQDCLQREQLQPWFAAVRNIGSPVISAYLQSLLLTGARREELAGLTWEDVDFQWRSLTIHDKVEGERTIPLPPYLATILVALPRRSQWVFSSPTAATGRIREPRIAHTRALAAAGLPHVSLHGLRRSFGTLAEWVECPVGVVAQIQGHKPTAIAEKHYRRRPLDLLRMWHTKIEAWILDQAGIEQPKEGTESLRVVSSNSAS